MPINPVYQTQAFMQKITELTTQTVVECRFSQTDGIGEILAVTPQLSCSACNATDGRVNFSGRLILFVVYIDDTGKLCRMQKGVEYAHYADDEAITPSQICSPTVVVQKTSWKREGSQVLVSVVAQARIAVYGKKERTFLTALDGAVCQTEQTSFFTAVPFSGEGVVEDIFDADSVIDVLVPTAAVTVLACTLRDGEAIIDGELQLSVLAMRGESPACLERTVPFQQTVPVPDAEDAKSAACNAALADLSVTATVQEDRGRCQIALQATLLFNGVTYNKQELPVVADAFILGRELAVTTSLEEAPLCVERRAYTEQISGACATKNPMDYACNMKAIAHPQAEFTFTREMGLLEGVVTATLFYEREGADRSTEISLPFSLPVNGAENLTGVTLAVSRLSVRQHSEGECVAEATLKLAGTVIETQTTRYVTEAIEGEAIKENTAAVSVVVPKSGDTLWDIAKRLKQPPEQVLACNPDVTFPLTGEERILLYRMIQS